MKKIISFLLTMVFVLSLSISAFAATDASTPITAGGNSVKAKAGETVTLTFTVSGGSFGSYGLTLTPQTGLSITDATGVTYYNGKVGYAQADDTASHSFNVTVKVADDAQPGTYTVAVNMLECYAGDGTLYTNFVNGVGTVVIEEPVAPPCEHPNTEWVVTKEATCAEVGSKELRCKDCQTVLKTEEIAKLPHTEGEWKTTKEPTCTEKGLKELKCTVCGEVIKTEEIAALGHKPGTEWASDANNHWHVCSVCGEIVDCAGHTFEWIVDKKATEKEDGSKHEECSVCHYKRNIGTKIPATGELDDVPQTNDITPQLTFIALAIAAVLGVVTFVFRRKVVK